MTGRENTKNIIQIRKDSPIMRTVDNIDEALTRFAEIQLSCAGTAIQKMILIAQRCVQQGVAEYSRFTSGVVPFQNREVIYTIVKLKRPLKALKNQSKSEKEKREVEKKPINKQKNNQQEMKQYKGSYQKGYSRQQGVNRKQSYNDDYRERNERREREDYRQKNQRNDREQKRDQGKRANDNERNRQRDYR